MALVTQSAPILGQAPNEVSLPAGYQSGSSILRDPPVCRQARRCSTCSKSPRHPAKESYPSRNTELAASLSNRATPRSVGVSEDPLWRTSLRLDPALQVYAAIPKLLQTEIDEHEVVELALVRRSIVIPSGLNP